MAFTPIDAGDVDFKSPIDETLMDLIRTNFDDHESRIGALGTGGATYQFKVNGALSDLATYVGDNLQDSLAYQLDGSIVPASTTFSKVRMFLRKTGETGQTKIDIKAKTRVNHTITDVDYQMEFATQSVGVLGTSLPTQSITQVTPTISILSIANHKTQESVNEILNVGTNLWRLNFASSSLDSDYKLKDSGDNDVYIKVSSATNAGNNGTFKIVEISQDGGSNVVVENSSGVEETSSPAVADLQMFEYVFANPVDTNFVVGENADFAGATSANSNGVYPIEKVNSGGNNIVVYDQDGVTQGSPAGTADTQRWVYGFASAVLTTDYFVGEKINATGHTNAVNDGKFEIVAINSGGNNIVAINANGTAQAGVAGNVNTNRWIYTVLTSPSADIAVNDRIAGFNHTSANNDGTFTVVELERSALNNIIVYNENGTTQGSPAGTLRSERMVVSFASDLSASYTADRSFVTIKNTRSDFLGTKLYLPVVEVNRGGGANYNIVVKVDEALTESTSFAQSFELGQVDMVSKSIFSTLPSISAGENPDFGGSSAVFYVDAVAADSIISLDLVELATGYEVFDLSVDLS